MIVPCGCLAQALDLAPLHTPAMSPAGLLRAAVALAAALAASGAFVLKHPTQPAHLKHLAELRSLYIETLKRSVSGVLLQTQSVTPGGDTRQLLPFNLEMRTTGQDWPAQVLGCTASCFVCSALMAWPAGLRYIHKQIIGLADHACMHYGGF